MWHILDLADETSLEMVSRNSGSGGEGKGGVVGWGLSYETEGGARRTFFIKPLIKTDHGVTPKRYQNTNNIIYSSLFLRVRDLDDQILALCPEHS